MPPGEKPEAGVAVPGKTFLGCFTDAEPRLLPTLVPMADNVANTPANCAEFCDELKLPYSGTQFAAECFCGSELPTDDEAYPLLPLNKCVNTMKPCTGDGTLACGAAFAILVYGPE